MMHMWAWLTVYSVVVFAVLMYGGIMRALIFGAVMACLHYCGTRKRVRDAAHKVRDRVTRKPPHGYL